MKTTMHIIGLQLEAVIGCYDWERDRPQPLSLDLHLDVDTQIASVSDAISDATDYAKISAQVTKLVGESRFQLIEALVECIAEHILRNFQVKSLTLTLRKPEAVPAADWVGITAVRSEESLHH